MFTFALACVGVVALAKPAVAFYLKARKLEAKLDIAQQEIAILRKHIPAHIDV